MTDLIFSFFPPSAPVASTRMDDRRERKRQREKEREYHAHLLFFSSLIFEEQDSLLRYFPSHVLAVRRTVVAGYLITVSSLSYRSRSQGNLTNSIRHLSSRAQRPLQFQGYRFAGRICRAHRHSSASEKNGLELTSCRCIRALPGCFHFCFISMLFSRSVPVAGCMPRYCGVPL